MYNFRVRSYRLGRRAAGAAQTRDRILDAAGELVSTGAAPSVGAIARRAGVSRITVYNQFGSRAGLIAQLRPKPDRPEAAAGSEPRDELRKMLYQACTGWAAHPALYRYLPSAPGDDAGIRRLAERLAESDQLRAGCSIKEAEDVIGALTSFAVFDRLHHDGRRPATAVAEILLRLAQGILA